MLPVELEQPAVSRQRRPRLRTLYLSRYLGVPEDAQVPAGKRLAESAFAPLPPISRAAPPHIAAGYPLAFDRLGLPFGLG